MSDVLAGTWTCWYCSTVLPRAVNWCPNRCYNQPDFEERIKLSRLRTQVAEPKANRT